MVRSGRLHHPFARAHRLVAFVHGIDEHEIAAIALSADAVDDELCWPVEDDLHDIVGVASPAEKSGEVELRGFACCRSRTGEQDDGCGDCEPHWRPASKASTTLGSASVEVSPRPEVAPSAILRRIRRMILPERVLGSAGVKWTLSGAANAPISLRTSRFNSLRSASSPSSPALSVTNA